MWETTKWVMAKIVRATGIDAYYQKLGKLQGGSIIYRKTKSNLLRFIYFHIGQNLEHVEQGRLPNCGAIDPAMELVPIQTVP